jgi:hypothetical protein
VPLSIAQERRGPAGDAPPATHGAARSSAPRKERAAPRLGGSGTGATGRRA